MAYANGTEFLLPLLSQQNKPEKTRICEQLVRSLEFKIVTAISELPHPIPPRKGNDTSLEPQECLSAAQTTLP